MSSTTSYNQTINRLHQCKPLVSLFSFSFFLSLPCRSSLPSFPSSLRRWLDRSFWSFSRERDRRRFSPRLSPSFWLPLVTSSRRLSRSPSRRADFSSPVRRSRLSLSALLLLERLFSGATSTSMTETGRYGRIIYREAEVDQRVAKIFTTITIPMPHNYVRVCMVTVLWKDICGNNTFFRNRKIVPQLEMDSKKTKKLKDASDKSTSCSAPLRRIYSPAGTAAA